MCSEASFQILILPFFLSTLVICSTLEKHLLKTTFSHLKNTKKVSDTFFPFAALELQKQPKGSFIKYVKICAESWGFICQELDCSEFLLQLILTPRERKLAGDPGPLMGEHATPSSRWFLHKWEPTPGYPLLDYPVSTTLCFFSFSVKAFWPFHSSLAPPPEGRWWQGEEVKLKSVNFTAR